MKPWTCPRAMTRPRARWLEWSAGSCRPAAGRRPLTPREGPASGERYPRRRARALALMVPRLGAREATRELLRWDQRLEAPGRSVRGGELASKYCEGALVDAEPDDLDAEETALLRSARRVWQALGIDDDNVSRS